MKILRLAIPEIFKWTMSHADDAEMHEAMRQDMENLISVSSSGEEDREFLKGFSRTLTEELSNKELPFAVRKVYRELLYKITDTLTRDEENLQGSITKPSRVVAR